MSPLTNIPIDLLYTTCNYLDDPGLNSLGCTSRGMHKGTKKLLHQRHLEWQCKKIALTIKDLKELTESTRSLSPANRLKVYKIRVIQECFKYTNYRESQKFLKEIQEIPTADGKLKIIQENINNLLSLGTNLLLIAISEYSGTRGSENTTFSEVILDLGADPNGGLIGGSFRTDPIGRPIGEALKKCMQANLYDHFFLLLRKGANPDSRDFSDMSVLHFFNFTYYNEEFRRFFTYLPNPFILFRGETPRQALTSCLIKNHMDLEKIRGERRNEKIRLLEEYEKHYTHLMTSALAESPWNNLTADLKKIAMSYAC